MITERLLTLIEQKRFRPELLVNPVFHGMEKIEDAINLMLNRDPDVIKPVVYYE